MFPRKDQRPGLDAQKRGFHDGALEPFSCRGAGFLSQISALRPCLSAPGTLGHPGTLDLRVGVTGQCHQRPRRSEPQLRGRLQSPQARND